MFLELMIKGFIVGIAFIIPGVSGGTLAIYLGIYQKLLDSISGIFSDFKKSMKFLIPFGIGGVISVLSLAKLFGILIEWNSWIVLMFFIGLLIGGIKHIYLKANVKTFHWPSYLSGLIAFGFLILVIILNQSSSLDGVEYFDLSFMTYLLIIGLGIISATTMIVPGISGSAVLMVLGFYTAIVSNVIGNVLDFEAFSYNLQVVALFMIGVAIGIIIFSKVISYLLNRFPKQTYFAILGLILASVVGVFLEIKDPTTHVSYESQTPIYNHFFAYVGDHPFVIIIGLLMLVLGFIATRYLTKFELKGAQDDA